MENPIKTLQKSVGLSRLRFVSLLSISPTLLQFVENGAVPFPQKLFQNLQSLGYDVEKLQKDYEAWRQARNEELFTKVKGKMQ